MKKQEAKCWKGRELAEDLAQHLQAAGHMAWVEIPLGSVYQNSRLQRADVVGLNKSFTQPNLRIYEVKVSRADYLSDIGRGKYAGYLKSADQVYFAVPQGLIKVAELPQDGVGLIIRGETSWSVAKAARRQDFKLTEEILLKLLIRGHDDFQRQYRSKKHRDTEAKTYTNLRQALYDYGVKVAKDIAEGHAIKQYSDEMVKQISELLGCNFSSPYGALDQLRREVNTLMYQHRASRLAVNMAELTGKLFSGDMQWGNPVWKLEQLLEQARKDFPEKE